MILVLGIGNFEKRYLMTRHSIGIYLMTRYINSIKSKDRLDEADGDYIYCCTEDREVYFGYSKTFMNLSGNSLKEFTKHISMPDAIAVLHDEIDIPFGKIKISKSMRDNGHNGIRSLKSFTGNRQTPIYVHIRFGIGKVERESLVKYVLSPFNKDEDRLIQTKLIAAIFSCFNTIRFNEAIRDIDIIVTKWRNLLSS